MTQTVRGRLPLDLAHLRDAGEENISLALVEQELSDLALGFVARTERLLHRAARDGAFSRGELVQVCGSLGSVTACLHKQREYDARDEELGREINRGITAVIAAREIKSKRAAG